MHSALILTRPSYPAMPWTGQRVHQRSMLSGPLVLGKRPLKFRTPTADKDQQLMLLCTLPSPLQIVLYGDLIFLLNSAHRCAVRTISSNVLSRRFIRSRPARDNSIVRRVVSTGSLDC